MPLDTIIPLGCQCNISFLLKHLGIKKETTLFEWFQSDSISAINNTLNKINWLEPSDELVSIANHKEIQIVNRDIISSHYKFEEYKPIFVRRVKRFYNTIQEKNNILFIRINVSCFSTSLDEILEFRSIIESLKLGDMLSTKFMLISTVLNAEDFVPIQHDWVIHRYILRSDVNDPIMENDIKIQHYFRQFLNEAGFVASSSTNS